MQEKITISVIYVQRLQRYLYTIVSIKLFISILIYQDQS